MKEINILLLGLGQGGCRFLNILGRRKNFNIIGVEKNINAIGITLANSLGITVYDDILKGILMNPDLIIDTTGDPELTKILTKNAENIPYISGLMSKILISIVDEQFNQKKELEAIINSTHDGLIAVNQEGVITWFNLAAQKITGFISESIIGYKAVDVIPNTRLHYILKTGKPELNRFQDLGSSKIVTSRVPILNEFGHCIGAVAIFKDITELRQLAEELTNLHEIKTLLSSIIESTQDAISVVDEKGNGILINKAYIELTGLKAEDVINKPATVDIAEGESVHFRVLQEKKAIKDIPMKVGPLKKEVVVNAAPIIVKKELKGSVAVIHDISELKRLTDEINKIKKSMISKSRYTLEDIRGEHPVLKAALELALVAAKTSATVLLRGESGTGKELFAHGIHYESPRFNKPFIRINCAALNESLLESELFGYVEGAFTGASKGGKRGVFEEANGGTLLLDEIGTLSTNLQAKLLRVLQEKEIIRVGGTHPLPVDVRIIAATNLNLEEAVQEKKFREDLYYRINVIPIKLPSLKERKTDIPLLTENIIKKLNQEYGRNVQTIAPEVFKNLQNYSWPGNIRELENYLGRAMLKMSLAENRLDIEHLPELYEDYSRINQRAVDDHHGLSLKTLTQEFEKKLILQVLEQSKYNKTKTAKALDITPRTLYNKMKEYNLH